MQGLASVLAEVTGPDMQGIGAIVASLGGGGFALWFAWYAITNIIPRMQQEHRTHVGEIVKEFRDESKEHRDLYREESRLNRAATEKLADTVDSLASKVNCPPRFHPSPGSGS